jgi:hypothetical protein
MKFSNYDHTEMGFSKLKIYKIWLSSNRTIFTIGYFLSKKKAELILRQYLLSFDTDSAIDPDFGIEVIDVDDHRN